MYNNPIDLELKMLKYGPTKNIEIIALMKAPNTNIPLASAPKANPESPNTVNINPIIALTTNAITKVMMINPR